MTVMVRGGWPEAYGRVAERLAGQAGAARLIFTGTSACVDAVFRIDRDRLAALLACAGAGRFRGGRGAELAGRALDRITRGRGGELVTRWPGGPAWVCGLLGPPDRRQVGGTGPQASWALAAVGARSVLALADRSAGQLAVIDPRAGLCADGAVVPAGRVVPGGEPTKLPHCILEFTADGATVPRSSRVILRFGDEPVERDQEYLAVTTGLAATAGAGLVSGLNGPSDTDDSERGWLCALVRAWSESGLAVIHHELAEFGSPGRLRDAAGLGPVSSVGMSLSELYTLAGPGDPVRMARDAAVLYGAGRVIVHADDWALAVHRDDPRRQADVLLAGNALAAARARAGAPTSDLDPVAAEAVYTDDLPPGGPLGEGWRATSVPAPHLSRPAGTVGLGDTFAAGILLAESLPP